MVDANVTDRVTNDAASAATSSVLAVENLEAWYGESHILHGINFNVNAGEVVTLLGRNGAGKTTTLRTIMGFWQASSGEIVLGGADGVVGPTTWAAMANVLVSKGIWFVPRGAT